MHNLITAKYINNKLTVPSKFSAIGQILGIENSGGGKTPNFILHWASVMKPFAMEEQSHFHNFDQYLCFFSCDPDDMVNLNAKVELTLSEDNRHKEKHIFTSATAVYVPSGLFHCPLVYTEVNKPLLFLNIIFAPKYEKVE